MDYELIDKITSSLVLTSEDLHDNFLAKKTAQKFLLHLFFYINCQNMVIKNGLLQSR